MRGVAFFARLCALSLWAGATIACAIYARFLFRDVASMFQEWRELGFGGTLWLDDVRPIVEIAARLIFYSSFGLFAWILGDIAALARRRRRGLLSV
ncbi:MAG TPA: hypothetical protein VGL58_08570 [Caulobacteraceae bacterium]|jgi:hypothetical protein